MSILAAYALPHPPLIIPGVADDRAAVIHATQAACREVGRRIAALMPQTIVISSPHSIMYRDYLHVSPGGGARGSFASFGAPRARYDCTYDEEFVRELVWTCEDDDLPVGTEGQRSRELDHGTMIALHFIEEGYRELGLSPNFHVVRMGLSGLSPEFHYRVGRCVQEVAAKLGRDVVFVASGDLSHKLAPDGPYGFAPEGPVFDEEICRAFEAGDLTALLAIDHSCSERAAECGLRSFQIMAGTLDHTAVRGELLSYEGPFGVGYGVGAFELLSAPGTEDGIDRLGDYLEIRRERLDETREQESIHVKLARYSLENYVRTGKYAPLPEGLPEELTDVRAGCFVSLKEDGELRGCIGTISAVQASLAEEILNNAVSAGCFDPRFPAVREDELDSLVYDVDVLGDAEPIGSIDELDPVRYGVIVSTADGRRGLLLPNLDGVDTADEQVEIAARKGQINLKRDKWQLERFEVVRHL